MGPQEEHNGQLTGWQYYWGFLQTVIDQNKD
ncbi:hypothetical protein Krac_9260 [Ktedonobacter racemifer DSM 44963]|uniref:Uncharacterized protein n=1 Tax=Ktedonobacter racemifer DSM 44963 TaxID=485913 RepID=D6TBC4_KTERA|nr:hypothetical protein Krac_9260 [Ktedonobacter racemifer DSM 44963]